MKLDTSDYYPKVPGSSCDPDTPSTTHDSHPEISPSHSSSHEENGFNSDPKDPVSIASNIISWVLVPLLVPVYATILILGLSLLSALPLASKVIFTLVVFLFSTVAPMCMVLLLKKLGYISDIALNGRKERLIPYLITILSFSGIALFFHLKHAPLWMSLFYAGGALAALVNMLVNFRWKISAHAAAMAGLVALLVVINREAIPHPSMIWWMAATLLLTGLLGSARVWLGRHTVMQVMCGYVVGFLCVYIPELIFAS